MIYKANKGLALAPNSKVKHIITNLYVQMGPVLDYACGGPFPIYDDSEGPECMPVTLNAKVPILYVIAIHKYLAH